MRGTIKGMILLGAILALTACGAETEKSASFTQVKQLSQVDWVEMTAAPTAATNVNNTSLIFMR